MKFKAAHPENCNFSGLGTIQLFNEWAAVVFRSKSGQFQQARVLRGFVGVMRAQVEVAFNGQAIRCVSSHGATGCAACRYECQQLAKLASLAELKTV